MNDLETGIRAWVRPYGATTSYHEYQVSNLRSESTNECYVAGVTNERFALDIHVPPDFDFDVHTHLGISYNIDDGTAAWFEPVTRQTNRRRPWKRPRGDVLTEVEGTWKIQGFAFGDLAESEFTNLSLRRARDANGE